MTALPSQKLAAMLNGEIPWEEADPSIQSWGRFFVYQAAAKIAKEPTQAKRKAAIAALPDFIRDRVSAELLRIWPLIR